MRYRSAAFTERLVERIGSATALDAPADRLAGLLKKALPAGPVKDVLSGTPLGHPAHPLLVAVPIGAWTTATYLDLVGGRSARPGAQRAVGLGLLSALPTVATGLSDWSDTSGAERRVGLVHAAVNDVAITLYGLSWLRRRRGRHAAGVALAAAGSLVLTAGGWLGGHLAYAQGVGVDTTVFQGGTHDWTDVGTPDDVPATGATCVTAGGAPVLVARHGEGFAALADRCTHRGAPLHEGTVEDGCVVCPWHDSSFSLADGGVQRGPATRPAPVWEVRVHEGRLQVRRPEDGRALRDNPVGA